MGCLPACLPAYLPAWIDVRPVPNLTGVWVPGAGEIRLPPPSSKAIPFRPRSGVFGAARIGQPAVQSSDSYRRHFPESGPPIRRLFDGRIEDSNGTWLHGAAALVQDVKPALRTSCTGLWHLPPSLRGKRNVCQ